MFWNDTFASGLVCIFLDDFPVQPMGQIQGTAQPSQQHLKQLGPAGYQVLSEEVPLTLHT